MNKDSINSLSNNIISAAIEVHRNLGPGLLEHTYRYALLQELKLRRINACGEVEVPFVYKGYSIECAFRADIIVENEIVIELKATEKDNPLYARQLLTYLKLANKRLGLLINFNRETLVAGLERVVNNL